jgi:long-subunit acyl-CoA synthetase (AMP-forming)
MDTECEFVDPGNKTTALYDRPALPYGEVGMVIGRGPQGMKGYLKNPEVTTKAISIQ